MSDLSGFFNPQRAQPPSHVDVLRGLAPLARTSPQYVRPTPPTPPYLSGSVSRAPEPSESPEDKARMKSRLIEWYGLVCEGCDWGFHHERHLELDHEVPKSKGGSNRIHNRLLLCSPCNRSKGDRLTLRELREQNWADGVMAPSPNHDPAWVRVGRSGKLVKGDYTITPAPGAWDGYTWRVTYRDAFIGGGTTCAEAIAFANNWRAYSRPSM